eukprot:2902282-Amphidinium_carterae.1
MAPPVMRRIQGKRAITSDEHTEQTSSSASVPRDTASVAKSMKSSKKDSPNCSLSQAAKYSETSPVDALSGVSMKQALYQGSRVLSVLEERNQTGDVQYVMLKARMELIRKCSELFDGLAANSITSQQMNELLQDVMQEVNQLPLPCQEKVLSARVRHLSFTTMDDVRDWVEMVRPVAASPGAHVHCKHSD